MHKRQCLNRWNDSIVAANNQHANIKNIVISVDKAFKNAAKAVIISASESEQMAFNRYISSAVTDNSPSSGIVDNAGERVHEHQNAPSS